MKSSPSAGGCSKRPPSSAGGGRSRDAPASPCRSTSRRCQLQDPDFHDDLQALLRRAGLAPECLILEVAESVLVADIGRIGPTMQRIRDLGVHLALDDFGTGFSSLLYRKGLPIDRLKVDRGLLAGLRSSDQNAIVVSTLVDLAHKLGLKVVALGVETEAELHAAGELGCDEVQGFLLGRPGPAADHTVVDLGAVLSWS